MAITWKVLDTHGPDMTVKYAADDGRAMTVTIRWNGKMNIDEFLSTACPLPAVPPEPVDASEHNGKTGTVTPPAPPVPLPPPTGD